MGQTSKFKVQTSIKTSNQQKVNRKGLFLFDSQTADLSCHDGRKFIARAALSLLLRMSLPLLRAAALHRLPSVTFATPP